MQTDFLHPHVLFLSLQVQLRQQRPHLLHESVGGSPETLRQGRNGEVPSVQGGLQLFEAAPGAGEKRSKALHCC